MQYNKSDKSVTESVDTLAESVVKYCSGKDYSISTAESLTGGMISKFITSVAGASEVFELGVCSYSDRIKNKVLGVKNETLSKYTAVSKQTAEEMSAGIKSLSGSDIAVAVTGVAGPGGGTDECPVGTVYVSVRFKDKCLTRKLELYKEYNNLCREDIRLLTTKEAFEMILELTKKAEVV